MPDGLWSILIPVVAATVILVAGGWLVRSYAGPAQQAYTSAVEGRLKALTAERDDLSRSLARMTDEIAGMRVTVGDLERTVRGLERTVRDLTVENADLMRDARTAAVEAARREVKP